MSSLANTSANVLAAKAKRDNAFRKKGIIIILPHVLIQVQELVIRWQIG